jgi:ADP-heptose:LPS heptosyltransferase
VGLGGYLTWTAVSREIVESGKAKKTLPCEIHNGQYLKIVQSDVWKNNPYITTDYREYEQGNALLLQLNNPDTNYCKIDTPTRCHQRADIHCIKQICEYYGIEHPELRCGIFLTNKEKTRIEELTNGLQDRFIVIEPHSKKEYTPTKEYSFDKWQKIVNKVSKYVQVVQVGNKKEKILDNVVDLVGKTTFREASGIIGKSSLFVSTEGGLVHAATAANTTSLVVLTGFGDPKLWSYPQNINVYIGKHGPCGLKVPCQQCLKDVEEHNEMEIVDMILSHLER